MFQKRKCFNPKRRLAQNPEPQVMDALSQVVQYGGNPEHKRNPGDFALTPPSSPRRDKTLCDEAGIFQRTVALELLREGIRCGLVSQQGHKYPQNIWAVTNDGIPMEAQLENPGNGTYHGYPMPQTDPFRELVKEKWEIAHE